MSFEEKIKENKRLLLRCPNIGAWNAGASRAYYCAFYMIKDYMIKNKFNYTDYLNKINKSDERIYSHGTICSAMQYLLMSQNKTKNIKSLLVLDNLYRRRRKADYEDKLITETDFEDTLKDLNLLERIFIQ